MTKGEQARLTAWRLKVLQQAAAERNVARVCRRFGISRKSFYKWKGRHAEHGDAGLCDRPRTPLRSPRATGREVVSKIVYLRQHYHFGPARIASYLHRFHQVAIASSSVHRILTRLGMHRLPANQKRQPHGKRWQRYEKPQPGHRLQLDTAIQFIDEVCRRVPFRVQVVQTDNGAEFQSAFHWHLETRDIRHVYIRPRTPHLNGKVERSHRVDDQEFYQLLDQDGIREDIHLFNEKLREWEDYYNYHRPHGALGGQTPYERLLAKTRAEVSPGS
jgi:transposase InsO family protein